MFRECDRRGVGGFTESLLAIMVVTAAVVLFTITISLDLTHWEGRDRAEEMQGCCQELRDMLIENCSCANGRSLCATSLVNFLGAAPPVPEHAIGYSMTVRDMRSGEDIASVANGNEPLRGSPIASSSWPLNLEMVDGSLVPGLLEVSCW